MYRLTEVVKNLIFINAIIFIMMSLPFFSNFRDYFILYPPGSGYFKPVQLITHMFMHGSMAHLFFNMLALYFFGPSIEQIWGPKRFLFFYLFSGFGAVITHMVLGANAPIVGASGAISGVLLAFALTFPNVQVMLLIPPIPMKAKTLIIVILAIDLFLGLTQAQDGIAHFAHLGGALFGYLLLLYWRNFPGRMR